MISDYIFLSMLFYVMFATTNMSIIRESQIYYDYNRMLNMNKKFSHTTHKMLISFFFTIQYSKSNLIEYLCL